MQDNSILQPIIATVCLSLMLIPFMGPLQGFGILHQSLKKDLHSSSFEIDLIGSISWLTAFTGTSFVSALINFQGVFFSARISILLGVLTLYISSFATAFWQLIISYGIVFGFSVCLAFHSCLQGVGLYFQGKDKLKMKNFAEAFATLGVGIGLIYVSPLFVSIVNYYNWRTAFRSSSLLILAIGLISSFILEFLPKPHTDTKVSSKQQTQLLKKMFSKTMLGHPCHFFMCIGVFTIGIAGSIAMLNLPAAMEVDDNVDRRHISSVMIVNGISATTARLFIPISNLIWNYKSYPLFPICAAFISVGFIMGVSMEGAAGFYIISICTGLCSAIYSSMQWKTMRELYGETRLQAAMSWNLSCEAFGRFLGPILAGLFYDLWKSYRVAFEMSVTIGCISTMSLVLAVICGQRQIKKKSNLSFIRQRQSRPYIFIRKKGSDVFKMYKNEGNKYVYSKKVSSHQLRPSRASMTLQQLQELRHFQEENGFLSRVPESEHSEIDNCSRSNVSTLENTSGFSEVPEECSCTDCIESSTNKS